MIPKLKIKVTKDHIMHGKCGAPGECAIAKAIREVFPHTEVLPDYMYVGKSENYRDGVVIIQLPYEAKKFIAQFDLLEYQDPKYAQERMDKFEIDRIPREEIQEMEFEIELKDELLELVNIDQITEILKTQPHLQLV